jgi:hypothetical protein
MNTLFKENAEHFNRIILNNDQLDAQIDIYMSKAGVYSCDLVSRNVPWRHAGDIDR